MAKCLRCGAGNEWIQGKVANETPSPAVGDDPEKCFEVWWRESGYYDSFGYQSAKEAFLEGGRQQEVRQLQSVVGEAESMKLLEELVTLIEHPSRKGLAVKALEARRFLIAKLSPNTEKG